MEFKQTPIAENDDDIRLDRWFKRHHPGLPHSMLEKQLRKGLIRVDGKKAKSSDRVRAGQIIGIADLGFGGSEKDFAKNKPARQIDPDDAKMMRDAVLYKDAHIIVINKPFGLPVQGGNKITKSIDDLLDALKFDSEERPKLVHRLDRDTSGCLVLARTTKAATQLMKLFSSRKVDKTYLALINNLPEILAGTIDLPIIKKENPLATGKPGGPHGRDYEIMMVDMEEGQKAITEYRVTDMLARKFAVVELKPLTGRTHQLRVHMAAIGCPIVGDHKYGGATEAALSIGVENVLHLHARKIALPKFENGRTFEVTAPLPAHIQKSFRALGIDLPKK